MRGHTVFRQAAFAVGDQVVLKSHRRDGRGTVIQTTSLSVANIRVSWEWGTQVWHEEEDLEHVDIVTRIGELA